MSFRISFYSILLFALMASMALGQGIAESKPLVRITPQTLQQGDVALVELHGLKKNDKVRATFSGAKLPLTYDGASETFYGLLGVDLEQASGTYPLTISVDGNSLQLPVYVQEMDFGTRDLTLPPSMTQFDDETLARIKREQNLMRAVWKKSSGRRLWDGPFTRPVPGEITGPFGRRTVINGEPRSPHSGVDLKAKKNDNIFCSNSGKVVLAQDLFFSGKTVVIDHGLGLFTMYFHLNEILVKVGSLVKTGQILGKAGSTGRSTGPHLHWGVRINNRRVDPMKLIETSSQFSKRATMAERP